MGKKKKVEEEIIVNDVVEEKVIKEKNVKTKEQGLFNIRVVSDDVKLRRIPSVINSSDVIQGRLKKGEVYTVLCEINYTPVKMYRLNTGYYIIADQNVQKI